MDEILQNLLSSELLSEEAKSEISTKWNTAVESYKTTVREEVTMEVRAEIAEQWATERDALIENVETFVGKKLEEELKEFKSDIEGYRNLQAEYAEKIVEEKHKMAEQLNADLESLIDKMDAFFEDRLSEEFAELREDLEIVKQNNFGRRLFEAFASEFNNSYVDEDSIQSQLAAATAKLEEAAASISKLEEANAKMVREATLEKVLSPLQGKKRETMEFILQNVETSRLEEAFNKFIGRVLKDDAAPAASAPAASTEAAKPLTESATAVVTGDESVETPAQKPAAPVVDKHARMKVLAGINK